MRHPSLCICLLLICTSSLHAISVDEIGGAYVGDAPGPVLTLAVSELNTGFDALYGVRYKGIYDRPRGPVLAIGAKAALDLGWVTQAELDHVHYGGFVIRTTPRGMAIAGKTSFGTVTGVRHLLHELGYRRYGFLPAVARKVDTAQPPPSRDLPQLDLVHRPPMPMRNYYNRPDQARPDEALATINPELAAGSNLWIDHSAGFLIPKAMFYDQHPEYFAQLASGRRIGKDHFDDMRSPLCLSNPDVQRISIERTLAWIAAQPDRTLFPITYGDTRIWCFCDPCMALDDQPRQHAGRLLHWVNPIARAVAEKHPDIIIVTFAYGGSDMAPTRIKPEPNVRMALSSGLDMPFFGHREKLDKLLPGAVAKIRGWVELAPGQIWVCEYSGKRYFPGLPGQLHDKLRWYHREGVSGILYSYGYPRNFPALWSWLYHQLMLDPEHADPAALVQEFGRGYYGGGGDAMARFFTLMYERYLQTRASVTDESFGKEGYPAGFYSRDYLEQSLAALREAMLNTEWTITRELRAETALFVEDALRHLGQGPIDDDEIAQIHLLLDTLRGMRSDKEEDLVQFARDVHQIALAAEASRPGMLDIIKRWLAAQTLPLPTARQQTGGDVTLEAATFMFGHGPVTYKGGHKGPEVTERSVVIAYVPENSLDRSDRMNAQFELYNPPDTPALLTLHGQDSDDAEYPPAAIRIELNGSVIFEGKTTLKKLEWSEQQILIPAGLLQEGINQLAIRNIGAPRSIRYWHQRWIMLSHARISF